MGPVLAVDAGSRLIPAPRTISTCSGRGSAVLPIMRGLGLLSRLIRLGKFPFSVQKLIIGQIAQELGALPRVAAGEGAL